MSLCELVSHGGYLRIGCSPIAPSNHCFHSLNVALIANTSLTHQSVSWLKLVS